MSSNGAEIEHKPALSTQSAQPVSLGLGQDVTVSGLHDQLERGLKSRHIQFLALGGAIGTGLFVGSGSILATCGPAPLFMAYVSMLFVSISSLNSSSYLTVEDRLVYNVQPR